MAAGIGSRFGGDKQLEPVGPGGETLLDYSVFDALRAGFSRVVFVIRRDMADRFHEAIGRRYEGRIEVDYAFQELHDLPPGIGVPEGRAKPWGTGQAVLAARHLVQTPFAVINADDYYGAESFAQLGRFLSSPERAGAAGGLRPRRLPPARHGLRARIGGAGHLRHRRGRHAHEGRPRSRASSARRAAASGPRGPTGSGS